MNNDTEAKLDRKSGKGNTFKALKFKIYWNDSVREILTITYLKLQRQLTYVHVVVKGLLDSKQTLLCWTKSSFAFVQKFSG